MIGQLYPDNEWSLKRMGMFTASRIDELLTEPKTIKDREAGKLSKTAESYVYEKAAELITGTIRDFSNAATEWGNLYESEAAELLKSIYPEMEYFGGINPRFFEYSKFSGGSPDGVSKNGDVVFEIKCPECISNHVEYCLLDSSEDLKKVHRDYYHQIQFNMLCVAKDKGIDFMDMKAVFASYCPIVTDGFIKLKTLEIKPDLDLLEKIMKAIEKAESVLADIIEKLKNPSVFVAEYDEEVNTTVIS